MRTSTLFYFILQVPLPGILTIKGLNKPKPWNSCKYIMHIRFNKNIHFLLVVQERGNLHIRYIKINGKWMTAQVCLKADKNTIQTSCNIPRTKKLVTNILQITKIIDKTFPYWQEGESPINNICWWIYR